MLSAERRRVTLRIPGDVCRTLAKNRQRRHWAVLYPSQQSYKGLARLMWRQSGEAAFPGRVRLSFTCFRGRVLDPDGAMWAFAPLVDGLKGEAFRDDDAATVEYGPVRFVTGAAWAGANAVTEVMIEEVGDGDALDAPVSSDQV